MVKQLLVFLLILSPCLMTAQKEVKVQGCTGIWTVSDDITPRQAEENALMEARKEALRKAGIFEEVWSVFGQISENENNQFYEVYSQVNALAIGGMMNLTDKKVTNSWDPATQTLSKVVTISAVVKVDNQTDREFVLQVNGIETAYKNGSGLSFTVHPINRDAYITIFWFDDQGGSLVFPNEAESPRLFKADTDYPFPGNGLKYELSKTSRNRSFERINLLFVATRQNIPFTEKNVTFENVLKWVYSIPSHDRATAMQLLQITD
ncbi:MAG: DUF4384 domain-containing protein [Tannerellaceae bacterium]|nr:DUF4384 domain-containing protein [Tannerellaceae bacterium]